jgi:ApeA N-terminal domain 1
VPRAEKTTRLLTEGKAVAGEFWPSNGGDPVACILNWTAEDGCQVEVIGTAKGWDADLGGPAFTLHGATTLGDEISLLDAWVNQISMGKEITRLHASTLAIGALTTSDERWLRAIYATANLGEWYRENGLAHSGPTRRRPRLHRVDFDPPEIEEVKLPRATTRLGISAHTVVAYSPDWKIETWGEFAVFPNRRFTLDQAHHNYAQPLLAFTHFALDRPDSLTREILVGETVRRRIEVLRQGKVIAPAWKPGPDHHLFQRPDLPDLSRGLRRWWALHRKTQPALGLFADHVSDGNSFSPSRLLTLYTALEQYAKVRFGAKKEFKNLRAYGGVPSALTGCTNEALKLLGASRGFFAHAEIQGEKFTADQIEESALDSTRRASALMQACLLREVGFRKQERIDLVERHYQNWRIP